MAQIRVSARWGGSETGKHREERPSLLSIYTSKGLYSPTPLVQGSSDPIKTMNLPKGLFRADTDTQVIPVGADRQEIALNSYKVRLQQGCAPGPLTKCVRACKVSTDLRAADTDIPLISG